jgi:hypothetical protein
MSRVIAQFVPSVFQPEVIQSEMRPLLPDCCRQRNINVRIPSETMPSYTPDQLDPKTWHYDFDGVCTHMIVWASESPTEILTEEGLELRFNPFDLVWFDNRKAMHRQPRMTQPTRWFACVQCEGT